MANVYTETAKRHENRITIFVLLISTFIIMLLVMVFVRQFHLVNPAVILLSAHTLMVLRVVMGSHALPANVLHH